MPALRAPPPTAPLPALPLVGIPQQPQHQPQQLRPSNLNLATIHTALSMANTSAGGAGAASPTAGPLKSPGLLQTSARARGLSVSNSNLGGDENRIEEEMKEN